MKIQFAKIMLSSSMLFAAVTPVFAVETHAAQSTDSSINVSNEEGQPVQNVRVSLMSGNKEVNYAMTDKEGNVHFDNVSNELYTVQVEGMPIANSYFRAGNNLNIAVDQAQLNQRKAQKVTFNAYVINNRYEYVKKQKVEIKDISGRKNKTIATAMTDKKGHVMFKKLPVERSLAVYINGKNQGYTIRGEEGTILSNTFYVNKKGAGMYDVETQAATIYTVDENDQAIAGQKVELYRGKVKVRKGITNKQGKISFKKYITVGTSYDIYVNGKKMPHKFAMSGTKSYVYLTGKEMKK